MIILSLFDGISCAKLALEKAGISITKYYASEIDESAITISKKNHTDIEHIGDVKNVKKMEIDLLIGGSPCIDLSIAKSKRTGLAGDSSKLFYEYVRVLEECKPKYFVLENVASMKKTERDKITALLKVEPIMIDSSLVSAQRRKRLFWTNIKEIVQPDDKKIYLKDILLSSVDPKYTIKSKWTAYKDKSYVGLVNNKNSQANRIYSTDGKSATLSANGGGLGAKTGLYKIGEIVRRLTPIECERLQSLPDNYTNCVKETKRLKAIGNAFNVDVMAHILSFIK
jgi:DNA (cytosine-5)-methyltransferase 3A